MKRRFGAGLTVTVQAARPATEPTHVIVYPTECFRNARRIIEVSFLHGYLEFAIDVSL